MLTEEQIKANADISDEEIRKDIADTQRELYADKIILRAFMLRPQDNRVAIYFKEGAIKKKEEFIENLNQILQYRSVNA